MFKFFKEKLKNYLGKETEETEKTPEKEKPKKKKEKKQTEKPVEQKPETKPQQEEQEKKEIKQFDNKVEYLEQTEKKPVEEQEKKEEPETKPKEQTQEQETNEKKGFIQRFTSRINTKTLTQETFDELFENLELILLENNVSLAVADKIRNDMEKKLVGLEIKKSTDLEKEISDSLKESLQEILLEPFDLIEKIRQKQEPFVILFFGINGSGKTTSIAKLAHLLKQNNISSVMAAGDTFRAASIEQLKTHGERLGINVISQTYNSDPAAVGFDAIQYAKAHGIKGVLIDTAGRMHTKDNLLKEMEKIIRVTKPDMKIFVAESITGNDGTEQAKQFNQSFKIDGTILTKADVDEKGGTAISIGYTTGKPILYLGTGQEYKDLEKFSPKQIIANLGL